MEWSVSDGPGRYKPTLQDRDGSVSVASMTIDGRAHEVTLHEQGSRSSADEGSLKAPMPGTVLQVMTRWARGSARAST